VLALEAAQLAHEGSNGCTWCRHRLGTAMLARDCGAADTYGILGSGLHGVFLSDCCFDAMLGKDAFQIPCKVISIYANANIEVTAIVVA
jgi:hypothetical protein